MLPLNSITTAGKHDAALLNYIATVDRRTSLRLLNLAERRTCMDLNFLLDYKEKLIAETLRYDTPASLPRNVKLQLLKRQV